MAASVWCTPGDRSGSFGGIGSALPVSSMGSVASTLVALGGLMVAWLTVGSPIVESLSTLSALLFALSAFTWLAALAASFHPAVATKFQHER